MLSGKKDPDSHSTVFGDGGDVIITFSSDNVVTRKGFIASYEITEGK